MRQAKFLCLLEETWTHCVLVLAEEVEAKISNAVPSRKHWTCVWNWSVIEVRRRRAASGPLEAFDRQSAQPLVGQGSYRSATIATVWFYGRPSRSVVKLSRGKWSAGETSAQVHRYCTQRQIRWKAINALAGAHLKVVGVHLPIRSGEPYHLSEVRHDRCFSNEKVHHKAARTQRE